LSEASVSVLSLGGTIAMSDLGGRGVEPALTAEELVAAVPELDGVARITAAAFRTLPSTHLELDDLVELSGEVASHIERGASGVVITQGTDAIEETAFALDLLSDRMAPVVITGAMRNPTQPGADGPANLLAAVRVAASGSARGLGTVVVMNDEIHPARYVRKTHASSPSTFRSAPAGPVGWISEGRVRIASMPVRGHPVGLRGDEVHRPVALLTASLGDKGELVSVVRRAGFHGLVVEGLGGGHLPPGMVDPVAELAEEMPVVLASRTGTGEVLTGTYGFVGSETDLLGRGLIPAGDLDGPKARILLTLLLRTGAGKEEIREHFGGGAR
jgi:L-asparaginase